MNTNAVLYVDADNQSHALAEPLLDLLASLGTHCARAVIAGNHSGQAIRGWRDALADISEILIDEIEVPALPDSADAALLMALGAGLAHHIAANHLIVVVSRDALLSVGAAQAVSEQARVIVAYAACGHEPARYAPIPTLALPLRERAACGPASNTAAPKPPAAKSLPTGKELAKILRGKIAAVGGGLYRASDVGSALSKLGYSTYARRQQALRTIPGFAEQGEHPHMHYCIPEAP